MSETDRLQKAEQALLRSNQRFRALLDSTSDVLYIMSHDWSEMRELDGGSFLASVHRPTHEWMDEFILPSDQPKVKAAIESAVRDKTIFSLEHRVLKADGTVGWTYSRAVPILDPEGNIAEWFGAASDMTVLKQAHDALRQAEQAKDDFLVMLAHELRNPLAPIRYGIDLLLQAEARSDLVSQICPMMDRQFSHLVRLVNDLLDVARVTSGRMELKRTRLDLNDCVELAMEQVAPAVAERSHELVVDLTGVRVPVFGDFARLTQVTANLLDNAITYMDPGGVINVASTVEDGQAQIRVTDAGYGVPADRLDDLFTMFAQLPEHRQRTGGRGLGVGLALCRHVMELHDGSIEATSPGPGRGTAFTVRLPLCETTAI